MLLGYSLLKSEIIFTIAEVAGIFTLSLIIKISHAVIVKYRIETYNLTIPRSTDLLSIFLVISLMSMLSRQNQVLSENDIQCVRSGYIANKGSAARWEMKYAWWHAATIISHDGFSFRHAEPYRQCIQAWCY